MGVYQLLVEWVGWVVGCSRLVLTFGGVCSGCVLTFGAVHRMHSAE